MSLRRSIDSKMWGDAWFENLQPKQKLLWVYLLTNSYTNMLGVYEISVGRISYETKLTINEVETILKGFESFGKAYYWCGRVFLPNWIKNQSMNTNMLISAKKEFSCLPKVLIDKLKDNGFESFESLSNGSVILPNIEIEIEGNKNKPSLEEVKAYFKENGYSLDIAEKAFRSYDVANWHDSKGNKIKNWKQKMINVWFREEYKVSNSIPVFDNGGKTLDNIR